MKIKKANYHNFNKFPNSTALDRPFGFNLWGCFLKQSKIHTNFPLHRIIVSRRNKIILGKAMKRST